MSGYFVYILTNKENTVLYTGVTNDLSRRIQAHREGADDSSFARKYRTTKLVYYEVCESAYAAISREKQIKGGSRAKKIQLIQNQNPSWRDLTGDL
jgi:putative endonuclease